MSNVLVVANETVGAAELLGELRRIEDEKSSIYRVVVPARRHHSDQSTVWNQEGAIADAEERLQATLAILGAEGLAASGLVGDMRPLHAVRDALMDFEADVIVISTHPAERSRWLRRNLVDQVRSDHPELDIRHVVSTVSETARTT